MSDNKLMEQLLSRCYAINLDHTKMNSDIVKKEKETEKNFDIVKLQNCKIVNRNRIGKKIFLIVKL